MPFLYQLINAKILASIDKGDQTELEETAKTTDPKEESLPTEDDGELLEGVTMTKPKTHQEMKLLQSKAGSLVDTMRLSKNRLLCIGTNNDMFNGSFCL